MKLKPAVSVDLLPLNGLVAAFLLMMASVAPSASASQAAPDPETKEAQRLEQTIRNLQQEGEFDGALAELEAHLTNDEIVGDLRRTVYILAIETYVLYGSVFYDDGRVTTAELNWNRAKELTRELLSHPEFRGTRPPAATSPTLMVQTFEEVRSELFGSFRLESLDPPEAMVRLDGELLVPDPEFGTIEAQDIPIGKHTILVRADGYEDLISEVQIKPGQLYAVPIELKKSKGWGWWALRGGGVVAIGTVLFLIDGDTPSDAPGGSDPLPGPPPPPGS